MDLYRKAVIDLSACDQESTSFIKWNTKRNGRRLLISIIGSILNFNRFFLCTLEKNRDWFYSALDWVVSLSMWCFIMVCIESHLLNFVSVRCCKKNMMPKPTWHGIHIETLGNTSDITQQLSTVTHLNTFITLTWTLAFNNALSFHRITADFVNILVLTRNKDVQVLRENLLLEAV